VRARPSARSYNTRARMAAILRGLGDALSKLVPPGPPGPPPSSSTVRNPSRPSAGTTTFADGPSSSYLTPYEGGLRRALAPDSNGDFVASDESRTSSISEDAVVRGTTDRIILPRVVWHTDPQIKLKLRKRFYPLKVTRLTLGADVDLQTRDVALKWSWKDRFIGGRLRFEGSQISLSKRFDIDSRTHMYVRAAYDVHARRSLFSLDVKPFRGVFANSSGDGPGFAFKQKIPVDRHVAVEVLARVQLPEARFSSNNSVSLGEGDFIVDLEQLNFRFLLQ
jgi:hypothetical protein